MSPREVDVFGSPQNTRENLVLVYTISPSQIMKYNRNCGIPELGRETRVGPWTRHLKEAKSHRRDGT